MTQVTTESVAGVKLRIVRYDPSCNEQSDRWGYSAYQHEIGADNPPLLGVDVSLPDSCLSLTYVGKDIVEMRLYSQSDKLGSPIWPSRANRRLEEHGVSLKAIAEILFN